MNFKYLDNWHKRISDKLGDRSEVFEKYFSKLYKEPVGKDDIVFDDHGHTETYSDGDRSDEYYNEEAKKLNVSTVITTDHDSLGGNRDLTGVEITCRLDGNQIEMLVYGFDYEKAKQLVDSGAFPYLNREFKINRILTLTRERIDIANKLHLTDKPLTLGDFIGLETSKTHKKTNVETLSSLGINPENYFSVGHEIPDEIVYNGKSYKVNYDFFIKKLYNYIKSSKTGYEFLKQKSLENEDFNPNSFSDFIRLMTSNKNGELYVEDEMFWPTAQQCIEFAKATGGLAILPHPFGYKGIDYNPLELMKKAKELSVDGIEAFHGFNESDEIETIYKYCYNNDLIITMGSDTHGYISSQGDRMEPGIAPGKGVDSRFLDAKVDVSALSTYNLHNFGSGNWRGEKDFDPDSIPSSIGRYMKYLDIKKRISKEPKNESYKKELEDFGYYPFE